MKRSFRRSSAGVLCALVGFFAAGGSAQAIETENGTAGDEVIIVAPAFDFASGNGPVQVVVPLLAEGIYEDVSATAGDATLVLRLATLVTNAWYDASAPYHPTAVGVYSRIPRRPAEESEDNTNINIAAIYASYQVLNSLMPQRADEWRKMLTDVGLDPDNNSTDTTTPVGIGNVAGQAIVAGRIGDGMNQDGTIGQDVHPKPYKDYTGYKPVNTPETLFNPSRWQPDVQRKGLGLYKAQQFVTPQYSNVEPYAYADPKAFSMPAPTSSYAPFKKLYKQQADEVLAASANLTDDEKLKAELFDNKIVSLGFSFVNVAMANQLPLLEFIQMDFLVNMSMFDAGIFVWQEKAKYDAVRPFSAIAHVYGDEPVQAWGGPGQGTVSVAGNQWRSYLEEADHPEYPSASTCFCTAQSQAARNFIGSDELNYSLDYPQGSSRVEPGITPAEDATLHFATWTDFTHDCGQSRVWAGVHFQAAVDESIAMCGVFGDMAHDYLTQLVNGTAPERGPSSPLVDPASFQ